MFPRDQLTPRKRLIKVLSNFIKIEEVKSISDFGAGVGQYIGPLKQNSPQLSSMACGGADNIKELTQVAIKFCDLSIPLELPTTEWVISFGV